MQKATKTVRQIHANRGTQVRYQDQLLKWIDAMTASVEYWARAQYRKTPPRIAMDATPSDFMNRQLQKLARRWQKRFDDVADAMAETFVKTSFKATDTAFRHALKDAGITVKFNLTPAMRDALQAQISENIALIKSIPAEYLQKVQGSVMRGYTVGRDLEQIVKDIKSHYPAVANRAPLIARDQANKANAIVTRTRQIELGITKAIWMHSSAGKIPRPDHVAANGKEYDVEKGCLISGEYIYPGQLINCRCTSRSVLPI